MGHCEKRKTETADSTATICSVFFCCQIQIIRSCSMHTSLPWLDSFLWPIDHALLPSPLSGFHDSQVTHPIVQPGCHVLIFCFTKKPHQRGESRPQNRELSWAVQCLLSLYTISVETQNTMEQKHTCCTNWSTDSKQMQVQCLLF